MVGKPPEKPATTHTSETVHKKGHCTEIVGMYSHLTDNADCNTIYHYQDFYNLVRNADRSITECLLSAFP